MSIPVFDHGTSHEDGGATTEDFTHVTTGSNMAMVVVVGWANASATIDQSTYSSVNLSSAGSAVNDGNGNMMQLFTLAAPSTGSNTVHIHFTANSLGSSITAVTFSNCAASPFSGYATGGPSTGTSATLTVSSDATSMVVGGVAFNSGSSAGAGGTQVDVSNTNTDADLGVSYKPGSASTSLSWTVGNSTWDTMGISIEGFGAAAITVDMWQPMTEMPYPERTQVRPY